jgi:hypothetical protein
VAISGLTYPPDKKGAAGSDGYMYRQAVGEQLGFGEVVKGDPYPIRSLVRPVAEILPLLQSAAETANAGRPLAEHDPVPSAYLYAPPGALTWLLERKAIS